MNKITLGAIGIGRMGRSDLREFLGFDDIQVIAASDLDDWRLGNAKKQVEDHYSAMRQGTFQGCDTYTDYRELLNRDDIDAVMICTPDHWHTMPAVAAAKAGKDIFLQKPSTLTIREGRIMSDTVRKHHRVFQIGSQQRSDRNFRFGCELVRNGYIGKLKRIEIGFGTDPCLDEPAPPMPIPEELHYDRWLGQAPWNPYTEKRVHPQKAYSRPGWLRVHDYGAGMITGWGAHHLDTAQWGMGTEYTGPVEIEGKGEFCKSGLWDVHTKFHVKYTYANGVEVNVAGNETYSQGVRFIGTDGWVYVKRWTIDANPKSLLTTEIGPDEVHLYDTTSGGAMAQSQGGGGKQDKSLGDINLSATATHKRNFIDCIKSRAETIAPVEVAHRSGSVCLLGDIAMHLDQKTLKWNPDKEQFTNSDEANRMLSRAMRKPWKFLWNL